jgi:hypothetical protein
MRDNRANRANISNWKLTATYQTRLKLKVANRLAEYDTDTPPRPLAVLRRKEYLIKWKGNPPSLAELLGM